MTQSQRSKPKRVPQRTCIACRKIEGKRALQRIVRTLEGVEFDPTGKKAGRGAYLCANKQCWQNALRSSRIEQALRTKLSSENRQQLATHAESLPDDTD